jgi:hypothetical protein
MSVIKTYAAGRDFHIDTPLSNLSIAFVQDQSTYIGQNVFPDLPVGKQSDVYYTYTKGDWFRIPGSTLRGRKSTPTKVEFAVSSDTYFAKNYALAGEIAWEDRTNADEVLELERSTIEHVTNLLMLDREKRIALTVTSTSNVGSNVALSGTDQWNDYGNSDPFQDIRLGMQAVQGTTGKMANTVVMGQEVFDVIVDHPDVLDRIKHTQRGVVTADLLAALIFPDRPGRLFVGAAIENTGTEGLTDSFSYVWGKNVLIAHTTPRPGRRTATYGYSFRWRPAGFRDFSVIRKIDPEGNYADRLDVMYFADEKVVASELAYLITSVVSA